MIDEFSDKLKKKTKKFYKNILNLLLALKKKQIR